MLAVTQLLDRAVAEVEQGTVLTSVSMTSPSSSFHEDLALVSLDDNRDGWIDTRELGVLKQSPGDDAFYSRFEV